MSQPAQTVRPLLRVRQVRDFTDEPVDPAALDAAADAARWSGSSQNKQPWRFIVIRDRTLLRAIAEAGLPHTRSLMSAGAAIAVIMPNVPERAVTHAYDEGRAVERILIAASMLGLGAGISWIRQGVHGEVAGLLGLPESMTVRTVVAIGHPSDEARRPKSAPGEGRRPRDEAVFSDRWPD